MGRGHSARPASVLRAIERVLEPAGADGRAAAAALVEAELVGQPAFGVRLLAGVERGERVTPCEPRVVTPAAATLDASGHFGPIAMAAAARIGGELAIRSAAAAAVVRGAAGIGRLAPYVAALAERGLIGIACTHSPPLVAPAGGLRRALGTNPIAYAAPNRDGILVADFATSALTRADLATARHEERALPDGTALDLDGKVTTDGWAAETILPRGGELGTLIGLLVELLAGILPGEQPSYEGRGAFIAAFDPRRFGGTDADEVTRRLRAAGGTVPGERSRARREDALERDSLGLDEEAWALLDRLAPGWAAPTVAG